MAQMTTLQVLQGIHDWTIDKIDRETADFITKTVNDLVNYYTKSETYTKTEVQQIVDAIKQFTYEVVEVRPTASASTMNKIYLVPAPKSEDENIKEEYITIQSDGSYSWEMLGTTSIDLSNYYTKGQTDAAITTALNSALASYTTTTQMNAAITAAVSAEETRAKAAEQANADAIAALQAIVADLETVAEGYVRVAGSSSPALSYKSYKYHEQGGFGRESVFHLFYPCLVGTKLSGNDAQVGHIKYVLKKFGAQTIDNTAMWEDLDGNYHAIDGSEGDVLICNIEPYYRIFGKHVIEGTKYDVYLVSRVPFTWQGIDAEEVQEFGWSPDYCVAHTDTDDVVRMHSVYNPAWNGSYSAPQGLVGKYIFSVNDEIGEIEETYDAATSVLGGAGGLHTTGIELYTGEQYAMNQNPDTTKPVPFYNHTAAGAENLQILLLAEGGTFDAHNASRMGSGWSANDPATTATDWDESASAAKNGMRLIDKNGDWRRYGLSADVRFMTGAGSTIRPCQLLTNYRNPWHIMEAHRAVSFAIQNDVHELEWFVFEGNKYKYRSVSGFNSPAQGEMTCVVFKLIATQAGANAVDPTDGTTSIAGNRVEFLVSTALFHGMTTQVSPSWWTSGLVFTEDETGAYEAYMERDQSQLIKSESGDKSITEQFDFEKHYKHVGTFSNGSGCRKNYTNDALMLPDTDANKTDAGLHTYVGAYNNFTGTAAASGKKSVRGFRRGISAYITFLSPLCVNAGTSPSLSGSPCAFGTCCRIMKT